MLRDPRVFVMGEDVGLYGGAYGATRGLLQEFGEWRVIDTPISEATIAGAAVGAAMAGLRPVTEIMYVDFTPLAMDQLANQGAKNRYMFGGKTTVFSAQWPGLNEGIASDGTQVEFTTSLGGIDPSALSVGGVATATLTSGSLSGTALITATVEGFLETTTVEFFSLRVLLPMVIK